MHRIHLGRTTAPGRSLLVLAIAALAACGSDTTSPTGNGGHQAPSGPPVAAVLIATPSAVIGVGASRTMSASAADSNGVTLSNRTIAWSSSNSAVAAINATTGAVTGVSTGSATITATSEGKTGTSTIIVSTPVSTVTITGAPATLIAHGGVQLTAELKDAAGLAMQGRLVTWSSSSSAVKIDQTGYVTALAAGSATITASSENKTATVTIAVSADAMAQSSITGGLWHSCGLTTTGHAFCWGVGSYLGVSPQPLDRMPVEVAGGRIYKSISAGVDHTIALTTDGDVYAWGQNYAGQLGNGSTQGSLTPVKVAIPQPVVAIDAGSAHNLAVTTSGVVYAWGSNWGGQQGDGTTALAVSPHVVSGLPAIAKVAAGYDVSFAITAAGVAYGWGEAGEVGDGTNLRRTAPVAVTGGLKFDDIAPGEGAVIGLATDGVAYSWGRNVEGSLGQGSTVLGQVATAPTLVGGQLKFKSIASGYSFTVALTPDGDAYAWGINTRGTLGDSTTTSRGLPVRVAGGKKFAVLSAGREHAIGFTTDGEAWGWGNNSGNQTGDGTSTDRAAPVGPAAPGYAMTGPASISIAQGASKSITLDIARTTGGFSRAGVIPFTGTVAFSAESNVAGVTATFVPAQFGPGSSSKVQAVVTVASSTATGSTGVLIKGSSSGIMDRTVGLTVNVAAPSTGGSANYACASESSVVADGYQCVTAQGKTTLVKYNVPELWGTWVDRDAGLCITWNQDGQATGRYRGGGLLGGAARTTASGRWGAMATTTGGFYPNPTQWYIYTAALDDQTKLLGYDSGTKQIVGWSFTKEASCPW